MSSWVGETANFWCDHILGEREKDGINTLTAPGVPGGEENTSGTEGTGAAENAYGHGYLRLAPDEAYYVEVTPPKCHYWNFQLGSVWWESLDYANHQTNLNGHSAYVGPDGVFRCVVSHEDPGVWNWLDTTGLTDLLMLYRFQLAESAPAPVSRVVKPERGRVAVSAGYAAGERRRACGRDSATTYVGCASLPLRANPSSPATSCTVVRLNMMGIAPDRWGVKRHVSVNPVLLWALLVLLAQPAWAATIGYWRMEQDLDPSADGLQVANEVAGNDLFSSSAFIDTNLPTTSVPQTGSPNAGSIGSTQQGGSAGINGTVAAYAALNVPSITIEFWGRTIETTAELFMRSSGANGVVIDQPSALTITFYVDDGAGGSTPLQMSDVFDMDDNWHHFAFTYDHVAGLGEFFVDAAQVAQVTGVAGRALVWDAAAPVEIGARMDYAAAFNGTLDEVRIDDNALAATELLANPEPGTGLLVAMGLCAMASHRRQTRARAQASSAG